MSGADSKFDGSWPIDGDSHITTFTAKGLPWSIDQLLADTEYGPKFAGGTFMHSFLSPSDYHRQHAPVAGKVLEAKVVPGLCYLQVAVERDNNGNFGLVMKRELDHQTLDIFEEGAPISLSSIGAPNEPGYQFLQARGVVILDNPDIGLVAVLPIGMAQVSSVKLTVKKDDVVKKGDEISYFQFGGVRSCHCLPGG